MGHHDSNIYCHLFFTPNSLWHMKGFSDQSYNAKTAVHLRNVIFTLLLAPK